MAISAFAQFEKAPAFPGAEGFGRFTAGGRGGAVCHVTSLEDAETEGTFRWAVQKSGARTIVFDVSGTIFLKEPLSIRNGDVSILGQTAPGDGICIADYPFVISANNVIIRYMRFRLGNRQVMYHEGDGLGGMDRENIIIDHCSVSWSIDECLSVYGSKNISVQWNIVDQSLVNAGHSKGNHGYGGNWGGSGASYHHNLLAFHVSRCPRLGPRVGTQKDERMDLRNCVMYNWDGNGCYGGEGMNVNIVNNYGMMEKATWMSFNLDCLRMVSQCKRDAAIAYVTNKVDSSIVRDAQSLMNGSNSVFIDSCQFNEAAVNLCRQAGIPLEGWTLNTEEDMRSASLYLSGMTSDGLVAKKVLNRW